MQIQKVGLYVILLHGTLWWKLSLECWITLVSTDFPSPYKYYSQVDSYETFLYLPTTVSVTSGVEAALTICGSLTFLFSLFIAFLLPYIFSLVWFLLLNHHFIHHFSFPSLCLSSLSKLPSHLSLPWKGKLLFPPINTFPPRKNTTNETASEILKPVTAILKPCQQIAVCHVSQYPAQGDLPQVPGSERVTVVVKHDCRIDCTEHSNSW